MRLLAAEPHSTAGLSFPSQCLSRTVVPNLFLVATPFRFPNNVGDPPFFSQKCRRPLFFFVAQKQSVAQNVFKKILGKNVNITLQI